MITAIKLFTEFAMVFGLDVSHVQLEMVTPNELPYVMCWSQKKTRRAHGIALSHEGKIKINKEHWRIISTAEKRELIYHELAHVVFKLKHSYDVSIMNNCNDSKHNYAISTGEISWKSLIKKMRSKVTK